MSPMNEVDGLGRGVIGFNVVGAADLLYRAWVITTPLSTPG